MLQRGFSPEAIHRALKPQPPAPPPPPPPKSRWITWETGVEILKFGTQVGWAYYKRQQYWVELERRVLASAKDHNGILTHAQLLAALQFKTREAETVTLRLCKQGICRVEGNLYLFESLLVAAPICEYCDQPRPVSGRHLSCRHCGAP